MNKFGTYVSDPTLAELYDYVPGYNEREDMEFYTNLCTNLEGGILELGCGTGRILIPIAESGSQITGLDLSKHMLKRCQNKLDKFTDDVKNRVKLVAGDMTDFKLGEKFEKAIIPFRAFQHLIEIDEQMACLQNINKHLNMNGKLVFDLFQVDFNIINNPKRSDETEDFEEIEIPEGRRLRRASRIPLCQRSTQVNSVELIYYLTDTKGSTDRIIHKFPMRYFFRYEIEHLLARCGFKINMIFGDFDKSPLADSSPEMIFVAEKIEDIQA